MKRNDSGHRAFTLVELLVVISIVAILATMLLPAVSASRRVAKIALCGNLMRGHAVMLGQYGADCRDMIPISQGPHKAYSSTSTLAVMTTTGSVADTCPYGNSKTYPSGYGWFFWQGYLPSLESGGLNSNQRGRLRALECPDAPIMVTTWGAAGLPYQAFVENSYPYYSRLTLAFAQHNMDVNCAPNANWDCQPNGNTSYFYRAGYMPNAVGKIRQTDWKPNNAIALDMEWYDSGFSAPARYFDPHGNGLNIQFQDGHVKFGGQDINYPGVGAIKPHMYYSMLKDGVSYTAALSANGPSSGHSYYSDNSNALLWNYYETGIQ